jgi:hypothetical protein
MVYSIDGGSLFIVGARMKVHGADKAHTSYPRDYP